MYFAKSTQGNLITAAKARPSESYVCPCCSKRVELRGFRSSSLVSPYFAHKKHVADRSCELYVASIFSSDGRTLHSNTDSASSRELEFNQLFTTLPNAKKPLTSSKKLLRLNYERHWYLTISVDIPTPWNRFSGQILINTIQKESPLKTQTVFNSSNIAGKKTITVPTTFSECDITKEGTVDQDLFLFLQSDIPCLNPKTYNFFNDIDAGGLFKSQAELLVCGVVYYMLTRNGFGELLKYAEVTQCGTLDEYSITRFLIPLDISNEDLEKLERACRRKIRRSKPALSLIDPLPVRIDQDGTVFVHDETNVVSIEFDTLEDVEIELIDTPLFSNDIKVKDNLVQANIQIAKGIDVMWNKSLMISLRKTSWRPSFKNVEFPVNVDGVDLVVSLLSQIPNIANCVRIDLPAHIKDISRLFSLKGEANMPPDSIVMRQGDFLDSQPFGLLRLVAVSAPSALSAREYAFNATFPEERFNQLLSQDVRYRLRSRGQGSLRG